MKAEKVLGVVACAVACVASVNAFADQINWFNGNVGSTTTSGISTPTSASWNATLPDGVTPAEGCITLDNDSSTALVLTPAASSEPALSDQVVTISSTAVLTPNDASDLGDVDGAKAGFAVGVSNNGADTNFYGYASGLASGSRWVKLSGTVPQGENASTTFGIVLDYRAGKQTVKFFLGDDQLSSPTTNEWAISATGLDSIAAYGSGSLTALSATCEKAVVAIGDVKYGSVADALADGGTMSDIKDVDSSGSISENATAANGLPMAVCVAAGVSVTDSGATITTVPVANDINQNNVTLQMDTTGLNPEPGVVINFAVKKNGVQQGDNYPANAILVPCETGIYTVEPVSVTAQ